MPVMPPAPAVMEPVPPPAPPAPAPAAPASVQRPAVVVLAPGETLADLARRWETSVPAIMMVNNLVSERVQPGTKLKLPPPNRR
jgi:LysM repeat protein